MPEVLVEPDPCLVSSGKVAILQEPRPAAGRVDRETRIR